MVRLLGGFFYDSARGRLCTDEEDALPFAGNAGGNLAGFFELLDRLVEVDDIDVILLRQDVGFHFRVPALGLVTKVSACCEQVFDGRQISHDVFLFFG